MFVDEHGVLWNVEANDQVIGFKDFVLTTWPSDREIECIELTLRYHYSDFGTKNILPVYA